MKKVSYEDSVFINCPFDSTYKPLHNAIVFVIYDCGFVPRSAMESSDSGQVRVEKIRQIIETSKFGIHDISRTELDENHQLPRFNMPFESGVFLGAQRFGLKKHRDKVCLILDRERYRYQKFISDIAGQDIKSHDDNEVSIVTVVRNWLRDHSSAEKRFIPGGKEILSRYKRFQDQLPLICSHYRIETSELTFNDYCDVVEEWLKAQAEIA